MGRPDFAKASFFQRNVGPLLIMAVVIPLAVIVVVANSTFEGSLTQLLTACQRYAEENGSGCAVAFLRTCVAPYMFGSPKAWAIVLVYAAVQGALMRVIPGPAFLGPKCQKTGHVPVYKLNGRLSILASIVLFFVFGIWLEIFNPASVVDEYPYIVGVCNIVAVSSNVILYFKGLYFPSPGDSGTNSSPIFDYYWGTELYPRVLGWDIKQFCNSRLSMQAWFFFSYCAAKWQYDHYGFVSNSMLVSVALHSAYMFNFLFWENNYFWTMDIQVDRAGFYIIWGVLVWVPAVYFSPQAYLARNPVVLSWSVAALIFAVGLFCIVMKNVPNHDRLRVRRTDGNTTVWFRKPVIVRAKYIDYKGDEQSTILLASGMWGIALHFQYVGEILGALMWCCPALGGSLLPYIYPIFLTFLLSHRAKRDDEKCAKKYGKYWLQYKKLVPYLMVPYIY
eukprot:TRINITY_DN1217_c0_g3_i1.p1 TRINITY_DN1217_c0_g3~~TRINITY_DN1217_c0_g3_i1.p1  ORF type:complete len:464 (-),score=75.04 TRINITY_DN1217_c0_g3_i1:27-1370(-)